MFCYLLFSLLGLLITWFVHSRTYYTPNYTRANYEKVPLTIGDIIVVLIFAFFPIFNIAVFIAGIIIYYIEYSSKEIEFRSNSNLENKIKNFIKNIFNILNKNVYN